MLNALFVLFVFVDGPQEGIENAAENENNENENENSEMESSGLPTGSTGTWVFLDIKENTKMMHM